MATRGSLHTIKEGHSVKEAVLSFIVTPQIQDPLSYKQLIETGELAESYHKFEPVKTVEVRMDINHVNTQYKTITDSGFKFIGFKSGKATNIIQGLNQPNSGVFTFNTLNYTRWKDFVTFALNSADIIASFNSNYKVLSFGLLFIDEFYFEDVKNYFPNELFNDKSRNLPQGIFDSVIMDYNLTMRRNKDERFIKRIYQ